MNMFLNSEELADLTDIRTGKDGRTREQRQIDALKRMKIPFLVSAIGRPKVARATIEGQVRDQHQAANSAGWEPAAA